MITGPLKYYTVAGGIRAAVDAALTNAVQRSGVVPGSIAWDECDCGMLAVSVTRVFLSDTFPDELAEPPGAGCEAAWEVVEIAVQVIRCIPGPDSEGNPPPVTALDTAAQITAADAQQTLAATALWICQARDGGDIPDGRVTEVTSQGPEGGCGGYELHALIGLNRG